MTNEQDGVVERLRADLNGALAVNPKRIRAFLRIDDVEALLRDRADLETAIKGWRSQFDAAEARVAATARLLREQRNRTKTLVAALAQVEKGE